MDCYDAIVLGTGGVGTAALMHLARRGVRALGIDRFAPGHDRGSSHGHTRLIRQAYFEHPDYVPLLLRAFELWHDLEAAGGETLYQQVGLLEIGPPEGEVLRGVRASAAAHKLPIENLSAAESMRRFPAFRVPPDCQAVFETRAGYLLVERCVRAHAEQAVRLGARLQVGETIRSWRPEGSGYVVETDAARYAADRLIVAGGPWAGQLLGDLGISLKVLRKPLFWFRERGDVCRADRGCPTFFYELPHGCFYGVPRIDEAGIKAAEHTGGAVVDDPLAVNREVDPAEERRVASFAGEFLPGATTERIGHAVCMYTMTPDVHFVVDRHPEHPGVVFAAGLSGHGFKFTGVLGEVLADLAVAGHTTRPIGFLSAARESLRRM
jgi:sarcosine oxidase